MFRLFSHELLSANVAMASRIVSSIDTPAATVFKKAPETLTKSPTESVQVESVGAPAIATDLPVIETPGVRDENPSKIPRQ